MCSRSARFRNFRSGCQALDCGWLWRPAVLGLALLFHPLVSIADVFKYIDPHGNIYFSDEPLTGPGLELEWKRTAARLAAQNREASAAARRERAATQVGLEANVQARMRGELTANSVDEPWPPAAPVARSLWARRSRYEDLIEATAHRYGLLPELLHAVIRTESAYQPDALSHAGACGLMQLMPGTAERFRVGDIWNPAENIEGGAAYLRFLLDLFENDLRLALAGYNAGENAVKRYGNQIPPYPETQNYVRKVMEFLRAEWAYRES